MSEIIDLDYCSDSFLAQPAKWLRNVAENPSTPPTILEELAYNPDSEVREAVADNPNTPSDTLWCLACDENPDVRYAMAENHNLPAALLESLTLDENPYVCARAHTTLNRIRGAVVFIGRFEQVQTTTNVRRLAAV